jgi:hypothetical protein
VAGQPITNWEARKLTTQAVSVHRPARARMQRNPNGRRDTAAPMGAPAGLRRTMLIGHATGPIVLNTEAFSPARGVSVVVGRGGKMWTGAREPRAYCTVYIGMQNQVD